jgi:hypothetical protein
MSSVSLPDEVRAACASVMERSRFVRIEESAIAEYAAGLEPAPEGEVPFAADPESAAAFAICMNAINFGSGWWPTIRKRPDHSGYSTVAAGVTGHFEAKGPWTTEELVAMNVREVAGVLDQDDEHPLMFQFAAAGSLTPAEIDGALWNRGRDQRYKSLPRPRSRSTAY